jgi:hypothetical protein
MIDLTKLEKDFFINTAKDKLKHMKSECDEELGAILDAKKDLHHIDPPFKRDIERFKQKIK